MDTLRVRISGQAWSSCTETFSGQAHKANSLQFVCVSRVAVDHPSSHAVQEDATLVFRAEVLYVSIGHGSAEPLL
jgi:hypothetical protein